MGFNQRQDGCISKFLDEHQKDLVQREYAPLHTDTDAAAPWVWGEFAECFSIGCYYCKICAVSRCTKNCLFTGVDTRCQHINLLFGVDLAIDATNVSDKLDCSRSCVVRILFVDILVMLIDTKGFLLEDINLLARDAQNSECLRKEVTSGEFENNVCVGEAN